MSQEVDVTHTSALRLWALLGGLVLWLWLRGSREVQAPPESEQD